MNKVILLGNIVNHLELIEKNENKKYIQFTIAVKRPFKKDETDFIRCVAFNDKAVFIHNHFSKGAKILIEGYLNINVYEKDGEKREASSIIIDNCYFCEKKTDSKEDHSNHQKSASYRDLVEPVDDEPLPF